MISYIIPMHNYVNTHTHTHTQNCSRFGAEQDEPEQPVHSVWPQPPAPGTHRPGGVAAQHGRCGCCNTRQRSHVLPELPRGVPGRGAGAHFPGFHGEHGSRETEGQSEEAGLDWGGGRDKIGAHLATKLWQKFPDLRQIYSAVSTLRVFCLIIHLFVHIIIIYTPVMQYYKIISSISGNIYYR